MSGAHRPSTRAAGSYLSRRTGTSLSARLQQRVVSRGKCAISAYQCGVEVAQSLRRVPQQGVEHLLHTPVAPRDPVGLAQVLRAAAGRDAPPSGAEVAELGQVDVQALAVRGAQCPAP